MCMCRVFSCVVGKGCLLWQVHSFGKTLLAFALLHFVLQGETCLLLQVSLDFLLFIPVPYDEKDIFKVLKVFTELFYFTFFGISGWDIDWDYSDIECFALETNQNHSVIFEIAPKFYISDCYVDYEDYSISSNGFLPT